MSESKHTPGPWYHHGSNSVRVCNGNHTEGCETIAEAEILGILRGTATANAHLIAAAPELLEALARLLLYGEIVAQEDSERGMRARVAVGDARAAIAKAKGEK